MLRRHRLDRKASFLVVLSLLFSQMALAVYLCPAEAPTASVAMGLAAGVPCAEMDPAQPALCHQHAAELSQVTQPAPVWAAPALVLVLVAAPVRSGSEAVAVPRASTAEAQPPPDPVFLATLRLRV